jgi:Pheromone A receptor
LLLQTGPNNVVFSIVRLYEELKDSTNKEASLNRTTHSDVNLNFISTVPTLTEMKDVELSVFATFSFLGFVATLLVLPWHLKPLNISTLALMLWLATMCLVMFINSIVWEVPVWCDFCE